METRMFKKIMRSALWVITVSPDKDGSSMVDMHAQAVTPIGVGAQMFIDPEIPSDISKEFWDAYNNGKLRVATKRDLEPKNLNFWLETVKEHIAAECSRERVFVRYRIPTAAQSATMKYRACDLAEDMGLDPKAIIAALELDNDWFYIG